MNDREHGAKHLRTWAAQVEEMVNSRMDEIEKEERERARETFKKFWSQN